MENAERNRPSDIFSHQLFIGGMDEGTVLRQDAQGAENAVAVVQAGGGGIVAVPVLFGQHLHSAVFILFPDFVGNARQDGQLAVLGAGPVHDGQKPVRFFIGNNRTEQNRRCRESAKDRYMSLPDGGSKSAQPAGHACFLLPGSGAVYRLSRLMIEMVRGEAHASPLTEEQVYFIYRS